MQLDAKFKKEQIGTLFVRVEALEGGLGGWVVFRGFRFTSKSKHAFPTNSWYCIDKVEIANFLLR
jgi:hypothetical protein